MSLLQQIVDFMGKHGGKVSLGKIYATFSHQKKSTIRGRINEAVKHQRYIIRTGRGHYMLIDKHIEAFIENRDSRIALFDILKANIYYDLIFLDIPYKTGGQKGGNRNLSAYNMITPEEFEKMVLSMEKMLKNETSQLYFMIAGGKSSEREASKYIQAFDHTFLKMAGIGSYTKLNKNGTVCNMGKYLMPPEKIFVYSGNGKLLKPEETRLDFSLTRPPLPRQGGYPTEKPLELLLQIIKQATNIGGKILDPFVGSGKIIQAALMLKRYIHGIEISKEAVEKYIQKRLNMFGNFYIKPQPVLPVTVKASNNAFCNDNNNKTGTLF